MIHVLITHYDRPQMLQDLLGDIQQGRAVSAEGVRVHIVDDASPYTESGPPPLPSWARYVRMRENHGKRRYWFLMNWAYAAMRNVVGPEEWLIQLADDMRLAAGFFDKALSAYQEARLRDARAIAVNLLRDRKRAGRPCWTGVAPTRAGSLWRTQWIDGCMVARRDYLDAVGRIHEVPASRWRHNPRLSSGVFQQVSERLHAAGYGMYQVGESLVSHGDHESKMNPIERKHRPLTA